MARVSAFSRICGKLAFQGFGANRHLVPLGALHERERAWRKTPSPIRKTPISIAQSWGPVAHPVQYDDVPVGWRHAAPPSAPPPPPLGRDCHVREAPAGDAGFERHRSSFFRRRLCARSGEGQGIAKVQGAFENFQRVWTWLPPESSLRPSPPTPRRAAGASPGPTIQRKCKRQDRDSREILQRLRLRTSPEGGAPPASIACKSKGPIGRSACTDLAPSFHA